MSVKTVYKKYRDIQKDGYTQVSISMVLNDLYDLVPRKKRPSLIEGKGS